MLEPIPCSLNPSLLLIQPILAPKIHISSFFTPLPFFAFQPFHSCSLNLVTAYRFLPQPIPLVPSTHLYYFLNPSLLLPHPIALLHQPTSLGPSTHISFSLTLISVVSSSHPSCFLPVPLASSYPSCFFTPSLAPSTPLLLLHVIPLAHQAFSSCSLNPSL